MEWYEMNASQRLIQRSIEKTIDRICWLELTLEDMTRTERQDFGTFSRINLEMKDAERELDHLYDCLWSEEYQDSVFWWVN